jgi:putative tricarboxylic transport membrane protein
VTDRIILVSILLLAAVYFYATSQIFSFEFGDPLGPKAFPRLLGAGLLVTAALLGMEMWNASRARPAPASTAARTDKRHWLVVGAAIVWTAIYFRLFVPLGYLPATAIYLLVLTAYFNRGKWLTNALTSILFSIISYLLFAQLLGVRLPRGLLPF